MIIAEAKDGVYPLSDERFFPFRQEPRRGAHEVPLPCPIETESLRSHALDLRRGAVINPAFSVPDLSDLAAVGFGVS